MKNNKWMKILVWCLMLTLSVSLAVPTVYAEERADAEGTNAAVQSQGEELAPFDVERAKELAKELDQKMAAYETSLDESVLAQLAEGEDEPEGVSENTLPAEAEEEDFSGLALPVVSQLTDEEVEYYFGQPEESVSENAVSEEETVSAESASKFYTKQDAIEYIRKQMVKRKQTISFDLYNDNLQSAFLEEVAEDIREASPKEGDYLMWHVSAWRFGSKTISSNRKKYYILAQYHSNEAQEAYVDQFVKQFISTYGLGGAGVSDQEKIRTVYWYITSNVTYDHAHLAFGRNYSPMFTAYAVIHDKTAICQGISNLFYRLMKELHVDVRTVTSVTHAWNIVKLNGLYYNVDATWDSDVQLSKDDPYRFFMKTDNDIFSSARDTDHIRESRCNSADYYAAHPMAQVSYPFNLYLMTGNLLGDVPAVTNASFAKASGTDRSGVPQITFNASRISNRSVQLNWSAVSGAARYDIYGQTDGKTFRWQRAVTGTSTVLERSDENTAVYYVAAMNENGQCMALSKPVTVVGGILYHAKGTVITNGILKFEITRSDPSKRKVKLVGWSGGSSLLQIPDSITYDGLTYDVTAIGNKAVKGKKGIKTLILGKNITSIGKSAFEGCKNLSTVEIRSTKLKKVGKKAFRKTGKKMNLICKKKKKNAYLKKVKNAKKSGKVVFCKL
ncbi:MAG: leucine-rich repeat protein [Lachnospiraceae bacterium]|nr:leucine-rich repeat protein [Lachnospiraceae bacterium]